jgi:hypothetical protein
MQLRSPAGKLHAVGAEQCRLAAVGGDERTRWPYDEAPDSALCCCLVAYDDSSQPDLGFDGDLATLVTCMSMHFDEVYHVIYLHLVELPNCPTRVLDLFRQIFSK